MFIILIAHTPHNSWTNWIPARFGLSDATEIFVFCSGIASAIAFGRIFEMRGLFMGTARILHRAWQVYWAHIALFFAVAAQLVLIDSLLDPAGKGFSASYNLGVFFENIRAGIFGIMTLTYVPNYWDILPMYLVILMMIPAVYFLRWRNRYAPFVFCASLWLMAGQGWLNLPAEPWGDRPWFFNPFAWQLVFFTGFAFMRGWLPTPPIRKDWLIACAVILLIVMPFSTHMWFQQLTFLDSIRPNDFLVSKSNQGILRYVHFLALAYVAYAAVTALGPRLSGWFVDICCKVGQQSLVVFLASMFLAQGLGTLIYLSDRNLIAIALVNLIGFALLVGVAHIAGWFKATPWKLAASHRSPGSQGSPGKPQGRRRSADRSRNAAMDQPRNPDLAGATAAE
jgi:hypothetical protein